MSTAPGSDAGIQQMCKVFKLHTLILSTKPTHANPTEPALTDHVFYNGNCEALVVPAHDGEVGILPHREAMILAIQEGELNSGFRENRNITMQ